MISRKRQEETNMLEKVIEILSQFVDIDGMEITENTSLKNDLGMNSFDYISVATELESQFDMQVPDNIIGSVNTIGDLLALLKEKSAE